jgi:hypothetical protein
MKHTANLLILAIFLALVGVAVLGSTVAAQSGGDAPAPLSPARLGTVNASYDLTWSRVTGGGETSSTGGDYTLGGTAGQPDPGLLVGGDYTLGGGFWGGGALAVEYRLYLPLVQNWNP